MAINVRNGYIHGYHREKAKEAGVMWRIHWNDGRVGLLLPTEAAYAVARGNSDKIYFMENMDMAPYIDKILYALKEGYTAHDGNGLFFSYIEGDAYEITDPATKEVDQVTTMDVRRRLQIYYTSHRDEMEDDVAYIEEWIREEA